MFSTEEMKRLVILIAIQDFVSDGKLLALQSASRNVTLKNGTRKVSLSCHTVNKPSLDFIIFFPWSTMHSSLH